MSKIRSIEFKAPIWKTALDETHSWLGIELRDAEVLQTEFAVLDLKTGLIISSGIQLPERWWVSIHSFNKGLMEVRQFQPAIQSSRSGKTWQIEIPAGLIKELNGKPLPTNSIPESETLLAKGNQMIAPHHYAEGTEYHTTLRQFLEQKLGINTTGPIEYAEIHDQLLFSYYVPEKAGFGNYFVNFGSNGQASEPHRLASELTGFGQDTFMVWQSKLVLCVTDHNCLSLIEL